MAKFVAQKHHPNEAGALIDTEVLKETSIFPFGNSFKLKNQVHH